MFTNMKTYLKKNERRIMWSLVGSITVYAACKHLEAWNAAVDTKMLMSAIDELELQEKIIAKVAEQVMRDDY